MRTLAEHKRRLAAWCVNHLPAGFVARPAEWFVSGLCFVSGLGIVTGVSQPSAVNALLHTYIYYLWGSMLLIGALALASGLGSIRWVTIPDVYLIRRVPHYRLGLRLLGMASFAYGAIVAIYAGWAALVTTSLATMLSAMCVIRLLTLGSKS